MTMFVTSNFAVYKHIVILFALTIIFSGLLSSCGTPPPPKGEDFLSSSQDRDSEARGNAFVSPKALEKEYMKIAVMPFRAPVELVGASIADMVATEILKTYKYELIERSQMEQILQEQSLGVKGVTQNAVAMQVGKILGVQGVIVGTVPEYGMRAVDSRELPAVGINIRMIDSESGSIIWTVSDSAIATKTISISAFATHLIESMIKQLNNEWVRAGDTFAVHLASPQIVHSQGDIRKAVIQVFPDSPKTVKGYTLYRSRTGSGPYIKIKSIANKSQKKIIFEDSKLLDAETYYYKVTAVNRSGLTGRGAGPIKITTKGAPEPLIFLQAESGSIRKCKISWHSSADPDVAGYFLYRAENKSGPYKKISHIKKREATEFTDKGREDGSYGSYGKLRDNFEYYYRIRAVNVVGVQSPDSPSASALTQGAPPTVAGLQAEDNMLRKIGLTWEASTDKYVEGYEIFRSESEMGPFISVTTINNRDKTEYVDTGKGSAWGKAGNLGDKTLYFYKINAINVVDVRSPDSPIISATTRGKPPVVTGLEAEGRLPRKVNVKWQPSSGVFVDGYAVYRSADPSGPFEEIAQVSGKEKQEYMDKGNKSSWGEVGDLQDFSYYYYLVRSVNIVDVQSDDSMMVSATTKALPEAVSGFRAENRHVKQIPLQWSEPMETDLKEFEIFRGDKTSSIDKKVTAVKSDVFQYVDNRLEDGRTYYYKIRAVDQYDLPGEFSTIINGTTKPLPSRPLNPQHQLNGLQLRLTWDKNPENDISRYQIERSGFFAWEAIGDTVDNSFQLDKNLEAGDKEKYRIIAIDTTGLESLPSDEIIVIVAK